MEKWKVNKKQTASDAVQISDESGIVLIAEVYGEKCHERARLIAAAPELLESLVELEVALSADYERGEEPPYVIKARAAIANAKGQTA